MMIKFYISIKNYGTRKNTYYPDVFGFTFEDEPFKTATKAHNRGLELYKELQANPDIVYEWDETLVKKE